ncbi:hypothetical protein [Xylanibacter ruminicola]|uniref:Calx-beta domain-containing protein n=1 Tax=Xylanibacter ruminicola TaxID=839 RepID=A0A1M6WW94_XYLRU|nr:hypothetical protein [Xylanibacter ruminicola]SHK97936.1 hypothetical protein SAMN05216463_11830 [Xylanibacter ruminicola]
MKKYILGLAVLAGMMFTACDTDNVGTIYTTTAQNISFENAKPAKIVTKASSITVPVSIVRTNTNGEYTVHYTLSSEEDGIFSDSNNGAVTFAAGEWSKTFNIDVTNMKGGTLYTATLTLSEEDAQSADAVLNTQTNTTTTISVMCDYNWVAVGTGFYSSPDWWEAEYEVDIEKAEGTNLYRIKNLFADGYDIEFTIGDDNVVTVLPQESWIYTGYGAVVLEGAYENYVAGTYDPATKQISLALNQTLPAISYVFGVFVDTLTMP